MMRLISNIHQERSPSPKNVLNWDHFYTWQHTILDLMRDLITDQAISHLVATSPEYIVEDDLGGLDDCIYAVSRRTVSTKKVLTERLRERFVAFRTYHGTRTDNVQRYYDEGLRPLNPFEFIDRTRELFLSGKFSDVNEETLQNAIDDVGLSTRKGCTYFDAHESNHIDQFGHYLLYGSEYLYCLAIRLRDAENNKRVLRSIGLPTLFQCDVPLRMISDQSLAEFAGKALESIFSILLYGADHDPFENSGGSFLITEILPPNSIVGHYHPARVYDPFTFQYRSEP